MTQFLNRGLEVLQRLYNFVGQLVSIDQVELNVAIQLVHDVRRELEIARGIGLQVAPGYWLIGPAHAHAGGDTVNTITNPRTAIASSSGFPVPAQNDFDVWLLDSYAWCDTASGIDVASAVVQYPALPGQTGGTSQLIFLTVTQAGIVDVALGLSDAAGAVGTGAVAGSAGPTAPFSMRPMLIPFGAAFGDRTTAAAAVACNISLVHRCWVGPRGVLPPGLA